MRSILKKFSVILLMLMMVVSTSGITVAVQDDEHQDDMTGYVLASKYEWKSGYVYEKGLGSDVVKLSAGSNTTSVSFNSTILIYAVRIKAGNDHVDVLYPNGVLTGTVTNNYPAFSNENNGYHGISHIVFYTKEQTTYNVKIVKEVIADEEVQIPTEAANAEFDFVLAVDNTATDPTFTLKDKGSKDFSLPAGTYTLKEVFVKYTGAGTLDSIYDNDQFTFNVPGDLVNGQIVFKNKYLPPVPVQDPIPVSIEKIIDNFGDFDLPDAIFSFKLTGTDVDKTFSITNEGYAPEIFNLMPGEYTLKETGIQYTGDGQFATVSEEGGKLFKFVVPKVLEEDVKVFEVEYINEYIPENDERVLVRITKDIVTSTFPSGAMFNFILTAFGGEYTKNFSITNEGYVEYYVYPGSYTLVESGIVYTGTGSFASAELNNTVSFVVTEESEAPVIVVYRNTYTPPVITTDPTEDTNPPVEDDTNPPIQVQSETVLPEETPLSAANSFVPFDFDSYIDDPVVETTELVEVDEEETPLADALPQTGQIPAEVFVGIGGLISAFGVFLKKK